MHLSSPERAVMTTNTMAPGPAHFLGCDAISPRFGLRERRVWCPVVIRISSCQQWTLILDLPKRSKERHLILCCVLPMSAGTKKAGCCVAAYVSTLFPSMCLLLVPGLVLLVIRVSMSVSCSECDSLWSIRRLERLGGELCVSVWSKQKSRSGAASMSRVLQKL